MKTLVHAFISSHLDYCNSLQASPCLSDDCVPVTSLESRWHLRSAESGCLAVTRTNTTISTRSFAFASAKVWKSLPADLQLHSQSLQTFGQRLKHYQFMSHEQTWGLLKLQYINLHYINLHIIIRLTSLSQPNKVGLKCPYIRPSVHPQKVSSISVKFGM